MVPRLHALSRLLGWFPWPTTPRRGRHSFLSIGSRRFHSTVWKGYWSISATSHRTKVAGEQRLGVPLIAWRGLSGGQLKI